MFSPYCWGNGTCFHLLFGILQVVGESGLFTPDDIAFVQEAGVRAVSFSSQEIDKEYRSEMVHV